MQNKPRLTELDALRGIAALIVVLYHFTLGRVSYNSILKFGTTGVDLFFIISGFVIYLTVDKCGTAKEFIVSRFSRLYPAYWACLTVTTIAIVASLYLGFHGDQSKDLGSTYLVNLSMIQHYFSVRDIDDQYWTLIVELCFYVFILLLFLGKLLNYILPIGITILLLLLFWRFHINYISQTTIHNNLLHYIPLLRYFPLFFAGIIFYMVRSTKITVVDTLSLVLCYIVQVVIYDQFHKHVWIMNTAEFSCALLLYFALFFLFITERLKWIVNEVTMFLGQISYCLYLIHNFIGTKIIVPGLLKIVGLPLSVSVGIAVVIVILLAFLVNRYVEKPMMARIRNSFSKKERQIKTMPAS